MSGRPHCVMLHCRCMTACCQQLHWLGLWLAYVESHVRGAPASGPVPVTRLYTPGGRPTSSTMAAISRHVSDVISEGLCTTVHPAGMDTRRCSSSSIHTLCQGSSAALHVFDFLIHALGVSTCLRSSCKYKKQLSNYARDRGL